MDGGTAAVIIVAMLCIMALILEFVKQRKEHQELKRIKELYGNSLPEHSRTGWIEVKGIIAPPPNKNKCGWVHCDNIPIFKIIDSEGEEVEYVCEKHLDLEKIISFSTGRKFTHETVE